MIARPSEQSRTHYSFRNPKRGRSSYKDTYSSDVLYGDLQGPMRVDFQPPVAVDVIEHPIMPSHNYIGPTYTNLNFTPIRNTREYNLSSEKLHRSLERANVAHTTSVEVVSRRSRSPIDVFRRPTPDYVPNIRAYSPGISPSKAFQKDVLHVVSPLLDGIRQNIKYSGIQPYSNAEGADKKVESDSKGAEENNQRFEQMMKTFDQFQTKVDSLEAQNEAYLDQINNLESKIENNAKKQSQVDASQASSGEMKVVNNRINKVESDFKNLNSQNQSLLVAQEEFDQRLDTEIQDVMQQSSQQIQNLQNLMNSQQESFTKEMKRLQNAFKEQSESFEKALNSQETAYKKQIRDLQTSFESQISKVETQKISTSKVTTTTTQKNYDPVIESLKSKSIFINNISLNSSFLIFNL